MRQQLLAALVASPNEAADGVLLAALSMGSPREQADAFDALLKRSTERGLVGVVRAYEALPEPIQGRILGQVRRFHHALRVCGRADDIPTRLSAMKLIALGRQGKLAYLLTEQLHEQNETVSQAAAEGLVGLARWITSETRWLRESARAAGGEEAADPSSGHDRDAVHRELLDCRGEIEAAVARALDVHRGRHGGDLLRAALLLCDSPASRALSILRTPRHGGQGLMVRRLQQPPDLETLDAFLVAASTGHLRTHFGTALAHLNDPAVLDALLDRTHLLKDPQLHACMGQVSRGVWWDEQTLVSDMIRRPAGTSAQIGDWIAGSGMHDSVQDERILRLRDYARDDAPARLGLLRAAMLRRKGTSLRLLAAFLTDPDERLARLAVREVIRRHPAELESLLLPLMTSQSDTVRRLVRRAVGSSGFEHFWTNFDQLNRDTRRQAGRAMLKILPDATARLGRRLLSGSLEQRLKALAIVGELDLAPALRDAVLQMCVDPNPRLRSRAVSLAGRLADVPPDLLVDRLLHDSDARVRANTIEAVEKAGRLDLLPLLAQRARATNARERANAIKAMHRLKAQAASAQLLSMLRDDRSEHRVSALWTLRKLEMWSLLGEVSVLARQDADVRVRRYALGVLRSVAERQGNDPSLPSGYAEAG